MSWPVTLTSDERAEWLSACRGDARCFRCAACRRDMRIEVDAAVRPYNEPPDAVRFPSSCLWPSIDHAIEAWAWYRLLPRGVPSITGPVLERRELYGVHDVQIASRVNDSAMVAAYLVVRVTQALAVAYADDNPWSRDPAELRGVLVARTAGLPTVIERKKKRTLTTLQRAAWSEIEEATGLSERVLRRVVRAGRKRVWVELAARGIVPLPGAHSGFLDDVHARRGELGR